MSLGFISNPEASRDPSSEGRKVTFDLVKKQPSSKAANADRKSIASRLLK
jgi:hypothetical protein